MLLEGLHLPLTTPFFADGRLNLRKLEENVAHYSLTPAAGLLALGETGEAALLSDDETMRVLTTVAKAALPEKVLWAGIARDGVAGSLAIIARAASLGYDVALVRQPAFTGITAGEKRVYLEVVADRAALPVVLAGPLPLELSVSLAAHGNVVGLVQDCEQPEALRRLLESTACVKRAVTVTTTFAAVTSRMQHEQQATGLLPAADLVGGGVLAPSRPVLKTRSKSIGFQVLASRSERLLGALTTGAVGGVLPLAAVAPQSCYEVQAAWKDGDLRLAEEKQHRLVKAARRIEGELGIAALKYACDLNGYAGGLPRLPLLPLTGAGQVEVAALMGDLRA